MKNKINRFKNRNIKLVKHKQNTHKLDFLIVAITFLIGLTLIVSNSFQKVNAGIDKMDAMSEHQFTDDIVISFTGDIMMSRYVNSTYKKRGLDYYFQDTESVFNNSDLSIVNIESVVLQDLNGDYKRTQNAVANFGIEESVLVDLNNSGINLFSFANNHIEDYGHLGLLDTLDIVERNNIEAVGLYYNNRDNLYYSFEHNGIKIAVVSASDAQPSLEFSPNVRDNTPGIISSKYQEELLLETIEAAKLDHDFIIAYMHWGEEYVSTVSKRQKELGELLVDAGSDLVVGHHPHVLQPVTIYKDVPIVNSLGNFIFDQAIGDTNLSATASAVINADGKLERIIFKPLEIKNTRPVEAQSGVSRFRIKKRLLSGFDDKDVYVNEDNDYVLELMEDSND